MVRNVSARLDGKLGYGRRDAVIDRLVDGQGLKAERLGR
jgi:hypothetical protein